MRPQCLLVPERVSTLILTSSKAGDHVDLPPAKGLWMFFRILSGSVTPESAIWLIVDGLFPPSYLDRPDPADPTRSKRQGVYLDFLERYHVARKQPFAGRIGQLGAALGHRVTRRELKRISEEVGRIGVITGDQDSLIRYQRSLDLHKMLPGSELVVVKDGGHALVRPPSPSPSPFAVADGGGRSRVRFRKSTTRSSSDGSTKATPSPPRRSPNPRSLSSTLPSPRALPTLTPAAALPRARSDRRPAPPPSTSIQGPTRSTSLHLDPMLDPIRRRVKRPTGPVHTRSCANAFHHTH